MPAYLLTGQGGTGKSTIAAELMRQGFMAFVLILPPKEHLRRLQTRGSSYGKDPAMQQAILANQEAFNREAIVHSAIRINATQSLEAVVNEILRYAHLR